MKYLVVKAPFPANEEVLIFSECSSHSWVATGHNVISAGKFSIYPACPPEVPNPQISVTMGSTTLDIGRDEEREKKDQKLIDYYLTPKY